MTKGLVTVVRFWWAPVLPSGVAGSAGIAAGALTRRGDQARWWGDLNGTEPAREGPASARGILDWIVCASHGTKERDDLTIVIGLVFVLRHGASRASGSNRLIDVGFEIVDVLDTH